MSMPCWRQASRTLVPRGTVTSLPSTLMVTISLPFCGGGAPAPPGTPAPPGAPAEGGGLAEGGATPEGRGEGAPATGEPAWGMGGPEVAALCCAAGGAWDACAAWASWAAWS